MSFNTKGFILAGTAIAIFGIGLYFWDNKDTGAGAANNQYTPVVGGSRRQRKRHNKTHRKGR